MTTFIPRLDSTGTGPRIAVKDVIDVRGVPTTAGCRAVEKSAVPAALDAACLAGIRAAGARIVGKTNLHELALLPIGTNPWFGTPVNPLDPALIPGGSSSGSAVAVATGEADIALGTDTGGSVRVPAACCGIAGLKTTYGRIPVGGVWPLAPSLDTVGPMARSVSGLIDGMALLEPGFAVDPMSAARIGRLPTSADPAVEAAIDAALAAAGVDVVLLDWHGLEEGMTHFAATFFTEAAATDGALVKANPEGVGADVHAAHGLVDMFAAGLDPARARAWRAALLALFDAVDLLALPTLPGLPPRLDRLGPDSMLPIIAELTRHIAPFNVAGLPCLSLPVPLAGSRVPAGLQLVGPPSGEERLLPVAARIEAAVATLAAPV
jgi:amidase